MTTGDASEISVLVVDDQTTVREALALVLDLQPGLRVVASAADGAEAVEAVERHRPDVVLMDLNMPVLDGAGATEQILAAHPDTGVVVLTTLADDASILRALGAGARGYLTKDAGREDIARAVRAAAAGQGVLDPAVQARLIASAAAGSASPRPDPTPADGLTPRELEVLTLIGEGLSNRGVAQHLVISEATVKTHINNLFAKAGLADRADAVRYAYAHGLLARPS